MMGAAAGSAQAQLSQDAVEKAVASALNRVVGAPRVQVFDSPAAAGIAVPPSVIPKGLTLNDGSIAERADGTKSTLEGRLRIWRQWGGEVLHYRFGGIITPDSQSG